MKKRHKSIAMIVVLLGFGFSVWKIFSKPLPTPDTVIEISSNPSPSTAAKSEFQEFLVGDKTITPGDLIWELELHTKVPRFDDNEDAFGIPGDSNKGLSPPIDTTESPELRERIVTAVIERKVLYRYIAEKSKNFDLSDPAKFTKCLANVTDVASTNPEFFSAPQSRERLKTKLCEEAIIERYLEEQVFRSLNVTEDETSSYYRTHEKNFRKPTRVILRQVVLAKEETANELRSQIKHSNFSELARKHSITPEAANGGLIGPFSKEQLPTLFDIVFSMNIGEISGVIKSEYGFHIIMPTQRIPPQTVSLTEAAPEIRAELLRIKKLDAFQRWVNTALNAISVTSPNAGVSP